MNNAVTKTQFAQVLGVRPSYVTKLDQQQRLVKDARDRVLVAESLALIEQTKGSREDVARRNAASKGMEIIPDPENMKADVRQAQAEKLLAESRTARAKADKEEMERDQMAGNLLAREDVDAAFKFLGAAFRAQMDVFPDQVAPVVAPVTSLEEVHAMLTDHCRNVLAQLGEALQKRRAELQRGGD